MNILLTGATGFLGSHLLPELAENGYRIKCLLRHQNGKDVNIRFLESLNSACNNNKEEVEKILPLITVITGGIGEDNLGLNEKDYSSLRDETDLVLHCAASTSFSPAVEKEQWNVNVTGTENLAHFAAGARSDMEFHYVSTAYVAGDRDGVVYENELDEGQGFYNGYERSKCFAEKMLRQYSKDKGLKLTVYRPGIIVGDSDTGRTVLFNGMYLFMRFLQAAKQSFQEIDEQGRVKIPIRVVGNPGATKNFVHIDYVVKMMKTILTHPETHGKTFHITHSNPPTLSSIQTVIEDLLGVTGTRMVDEESFLKQPPTELEGLLSQQLSFYAPYLLKEPLFDNGSIKSSLPQSVRPECPPMDHEALEKLFSYAIESKWGRKMIL